ncbi:MAG: type II/IV secretion system protein [Planctomycetes bacterium]|nr:type II/IV secretion system protein [Planctomycetota bacterium]MBI3833511.1 type II/IV secretion system protein [Planctomycetota bacterium]
MIASVAAEQRIVGKLLVDGTLNGTAYSAMRRESEVMGLPLVEVLIANDLVSDADAAQAYADLAGLRFLDLTRRQPNRAWALTLAENVARTKDCVIFGEVTNELVAVVADPMDQTVRAAIQSRFERPIQYVVSPRYQIREAVSEIYSTARSQGARLTALAPVASRVETTSATGINIIEQFDSIVDEAVDRRASDIHIEPEHDRLRIRLRIDGRMIEVRAFPPEVAQPLISRLKVLCKLDITERRKPQDGRISHRSFDQNIDIRVAVIPTARGERATLRLLSQDRSQLTLESLGMSIEMRQAFERLIHRPYGIILLTGPTGSGKTTTLYVALQCVNTVDRHIITVEDPVEYHIDGVNQVAVDAEFGVSFSAALRSILRHDPDIVMVGEIRDAETAHLALEASLTGHLVFATLHTNSAAGAVTRLLDMGCEPYLVASALIGSMAQRLVRKICANCKRAYEANEAERKIMGIPEDRAEAKIYRGTGCSRCLRSGYYDRIGVFEYVPFDTGLSALVIEKATTETLQDYAIAHGAITLRDDAIAKVREGLTTLEEALRVTVYSE